jgi:cobalt/nickel transport system ATP-binding protein
LKGLDNAMLIASHDMALVSALCPRMVVIDEGHIVVDGPTADILSDQPLLEEHGLQ